jgi:hypothetical protein
MDDVSCWQAYHPKSFLRQHQQAEQEEKGTRKEEAVSQAQEQLIALQGVQATAEELQAEAEGQLQLLSANPAHAAHHLSALMDQAQVAAALAEQAAQAEASVLAAAAAAGVVPGLEGSSAALTAMNIVNAVSAAAGNVQQTAAAVESTLEQGQFLAAAATVAEAEAAP